MARFRLSRPAQADLANILALSAARWGTESRRRYAVFLVTAFRDLANAPDGPATRDRPELLAGLRSFHLRHASADGASAKIKKPPHVIYYRAVSPDLIEIVRVLHERVEPSRHVPRSGVAKRTELKARLRGA